MVQQQIMSLEHLAVQRYFSFDISAMCNLDSLLVQNSSMSQADEQKVPADDEPSK